MIFKMIVGVATHRPPAHHATVFVVLDAKTLAEAHTLAAQIACAHPMVEMPVFTLQA